MRLILALKSAKAFFTARGLMRHGSVKLPGSPSFSVSPSVKFFVAGRGGAGKGGSCMLIPDLVVMEKVDASGFGVLLLLIVESIWEYFSRSSLR
ncbi:hypothetical protein Tco_0302366, partial [Tanacetum coccineum]